MNNQMKIDAGHVRALLRETGTSPEEFGVRCGVSGMTVRRWIKKAGPAPISASYEPGIRDGVFGLIADGSLKSDSPTAKEILAAFRSPFFDAALKNLGLEGFSANPSENMQNQFVSALGQIGVDREHIRVVDKGKEKIALFKKMGAGWSKRVGGLMNIIASKKLSTMDKIVAYGALFYLLTPFDLIPDYIPVFGLMDDYAVLGIALTYYAKKKF
jgi:uncharacterized membrane protein YkvA (DUF1232 family)